MTKTQQPITVKIGKGVMSKDGSMPYAAGTIHATRANGFMSPYRFSFETVAHLLADPSVREIQIIDEDNVQSTITKNWIEIDRSEIEARIAATSAILAGSKAAHAGNKTSGTKRKAASAKAATSTKVA